MLLLKNGPRDFDRDQGFKENIRVASPGALEETELNPAWIDGGRTASDSSIWLRMSVFSRMRSRRRPHTGVH